MSSDDQEYGLRYQLSEHNAGRSCGVCQESADIYYFEDGETSTFRCAEHLLE